MEDNIQEIISYYGEKILMLYQLAFDPWSDKFIFWYSGNVCKARGWKARIQSTNDENQKVREPMNNFMLPNNSWR